MLIPLIIAILMGLVTPTTKNVDCNSRTVYVKLDEAAPQASTLGTDSIPPDGGGEDGPGGDNGHIPPPKS